MKKLLSIFTIGSACLVSNVSCSSNLVSAVGIPNAFKRVPKGEFRMGDGRYKDAPVHWVSLNEYYILATEVTVAQFREFINDSKYITDAESETGEDNGIYVAGSIYKKSGVNWRCDAAGNRRPTSEDNHPVVHITHNDAIAYCEWLNRAHPVVGMVYRLPTEAEWEYAARGGEADIKLHDYIFSGCNEADLGKYAWYDGNNNNFNNTHAVSTNQPNALGLYDMSGNVWEWCSDGYDSDYYKNSPKQDPENCTSELFFVVRGGSWIPHTESCSSSRRNCGSPTNRYGNLGFRVVLAARR
ncbi:MAG: formylglycine-generating enzyme family protein [Chitinophagia bacterium]|nr:formylglycine-generating enzyme family protein [Chitinophagia bacterium]